jgi:hypothetical protein
MKKTLLAFVFVLGIALYPVKTQATCVVCGGGPSGGGIAVLAIGVLSLFDAPAAPSAAKKATTEFALLNNDSNKLVLLNQSAGGSNTAEIINH